MALMDSTSGASDAGRDVANDVARRLLGDDFSSVLGGTRRGGETVDPGRRPADPGTLVGGIVQWATDAEADGADALAPIYTAQLPDTPETRRRYFSENTVPMNTVVVSHQTERDAQAGLAIVRALHAANPEAKIALLVPNYDAGDPGQLAELATYYGVPESALAPVQVGSSTLGSGAIGLWPQDGFLAGAGGLYEPGVGTQHAGDVAEAISAAFGLPIEERDYIGMGGDTHFLTRPGGEQVAYFGGDTISHAAGTLNETRTAQDQLSPGEPDDRLLVIGHIMEKMSEGGIALEDIAPIGISRDGHTYGSVLDAMTPEQLSELRPDVLERLQEMRDLPFPMSYPTNAGGYAYHSDLVMASPDGVHAYVNSDDLDEIPGWREQLEFFGYEPVPLPASYERSESRARIVSERNSYTNWIMGEVNGETVILLPTEADDPTQLTPNDRAAIAAFQENNPEVRIVPMGGNTVRMFVNDPETLDTRDWGAHCRTNVLPWIIEAVPLDSVLEDTLLDEVAVAGL